MLVAHDNGCCTWVFSNLTLTHGNPGARLSPVLTTQTPLAHTPMEGKSTAKSAHVTVLLQWASCWLLRDRDEATAVLTLDLSPVLFGSERRNAKGWRSQGWWLKLPGVTQLRVQRGGSSLKRMVASKGPASPQETQTLH